MGRVASVSGSVYSGSDHTDHTGLYIYDRNFSSIAVQENHYYPCAQYVVDTAIVVLRQ
jgi:hypothetical protein